MQSPADSTHKFIAVEATVTVILLGMVSVLIKAISANVFTIGIFRLSIATAGMLAVLRLRGLLVSLSARQILALAGMGLFFGGHWLLFFVSIKVSTASVAALALSSYGIYVLFLGWLFRGAKPFWIDFVAIAAAICGNMLIVPEFSLDNDIALGVILGLLSGFLFACMPIWHQKFYDIPASTRTLGQFGFALLFFMVFFPWTDWSLPAGDWLGLLFLGFFCTLLAHWLWIRVISYVSTPTSSLIYYMMIPVAMILSYIFLDESMQREKLLGAGLIILANLTGLFSQWKRQTWLAKQPVD